VIGNYDGNLHAFENEGGAFTELTGAENPFDGRYFGRRTAPGFVARARATGWAEAIEEFRRSCLELAPQPGSEEDPLFEGGVRPVPTDSE